MSVAHLQHKRTGRPRGSKSSSPLKRDLMWAYRNLGKDVEPPTDGARYWAKMASEQPEKFVAAMKVLDETIRRSRDEPQNGKPVARAGQRLKTVVLTEKELLKILMSRRGWDVPADGKLVGYALNQARGEVLFTIGSAEFQPLEEEQVVPELGPRFTRLV